MMLADPHFVIAEVVHPLDQLHVAAEGERRVLADAMERGQEDAERHAFVCHGVNVSMRRAPTRRARAACAGYAIVSTVPSRSMSSSSTCIAWCRSRIAVRSRLSWSVCAAVSSPRFWQHAGPRMMS